MSKSSPAPRVGESRHLTSSILLWMRTDQPRQTGMDHWKGPHSGIISATPGLEEYRQLHLAETNPGSWPSTDGVETRIATDRKVDGVAEVTFQSALSPLYGRAQTQLAYKDEVNVFRRTLLYAGPPGSSRWYDVAGLGESVGARALIYLRRRDDVSAHDFRMVIKKGVVPALIGSGVLKELRSQAFLPWSEKLWDTPNVAHDNPIGDRFHGSLILGFTDADTRAMFFERHATGYLSDVLAPVASAVHAYEVSETLTFVKDGEVLPHHQG